MDNFCYPRKIHHLSFLFGGIRIRTLSSGKCITYICNQNTTLFSDIKICFSLAAEWKSESQF